MKKQFLFLLAIGFSLLSIAQGNQTATAYIHAPSGLSMRAQALATASRLQVIPYGAEVQVQTPSLGSLTGKAYEEIPFNHLAVGDLMTVDGLRGRWLKVQYQGQTGYVFAGYLSRLPAPKKQYQELSEYFVATFEEAAKAVETEGNDGDEGFGKDVYHWMDNGVEWLEATGYESYTDYFNISGVTVQEVFMVMKNGLNREFLQRKFPQKELSEKLKSKLENGYSIVEISAQVDSYGNITSFYAAWDEGPYMEFTIRKMANGKIQVSEGGGV